VTNELNFDSIELMETTQTSFDHLLRENLMGEAHKDALKLNFDCGLKLEFHGTKITSDRLSGPRELSWTPLLYILEEFKPDREC